MRILVVEDNKDIRELVSLGLEAAGYAVDMAGDGERGAALSRINEYDCVILDFNLPKKSGLELCRELREAGKSMAILVLTVRSNIEDKVEFLKAGADDYLTKPFSFEELLARVSSLLRRSRTMSPEILQIENLELNTGTQEVKKGGKQIYLTRKEFALLEYLMRQQGSVVSRNMILEHVWDMETDPFSNTVEAHIFNLRKKVGGSKSYKIIENVPGRGYRINALSHS